MVLGGPGHWLPPRAPGKVFDLLLVVLFFMFFRVLGFRDLYRLAFCSASRSFSVAFVCRFSTRLVQNRAVLVGFHKNCVELSGSVGGSRV